MTATAVALPVLLFGLAVLSCAGTDRTEPLPCIARTVDGGVPDVVPGSLAVRFKDTITSDAEASEVIERHGYAISEFVARGIRYDVTVSVPEGSECDAADVLGADPDVESASPRLLVGV